MLGLPCKWEIEWFNTLMYLQAAVPEYIEEHCPDPQTAAQVLGKLYHPKRGPFFPSLFDKTPADIE